LEDQRRQSLAQLNGIRSKIGIWESDDKPKKRFPIGTLSACCLYGSFVDRPHKDTAYIALFERRSLKCQSQLAYGWRHEGFRYDITY
jgi:hypothetical protein